MANNNGEAKRKREDSAEGVLNTLNEKIGELIKINGVMTRLDKQLSFQSSIDELTVREIKLLSERLEKLAEMEGKFDQWEKTMEHLLKKLNHFANKTQETIDVAVRQAQKNIEGSVQRFNVAGLDLYREAYFKVVYYERRLLVAALLVAVTVGALVGLGTGYWISRRQSAPIQNRLSLIEQQVKRAPAADRGAHPNRPSHSRKRQ